MGRIILILACVIAGVLGGAGVQYFFYGIEAGKLVANEIVLIDENTGLVYAKLSSYHEDGTSGLILYDSNGSPRITNVITEQASMISLLDANQSVRSSLTFDGDNSILFFYGAENNTMASVGVTENEGSLTLSDSKGSAATVIAFHEKKPFIELFSNDKTLFTTIQAE